METTDIDFVTCEEVSGPPALVPMGEKDLVNIADRIEGSLQAYQRILAKAIQFTHAGDWVDQNGKPYLMGSGAERIARPFGISISKPKIWREDRKDAKGDFYIYFCQAVVGSRALDVEMTFEGSCSSRDRFFAQVTTYQNNQKVTNLRPAEDIDETNIRKKAYTNMFVNGVTRLLGIRGLQWSFLEECGIKKAEAARVEYGGKGAAETISDKQAGLLAAKLKEKQDLGADGAALKAEFCKEFKIKALKELPRGKMNDVLAWIESIKV
jgi:hypothetical protein